MDEAVYSENLSSLNSLENIVNQNGTSELMYRSSESDGSTNYSRNIPKPRIKRKGQKSTDLHEKNIQNEKDSPFSDILKELCQKNNDKIEKKEEKETFEIKKDMSTIISSLDNQMKMQIIKSEEEFRKKSDNIKDLMYAKIKTSIPLSTPKSNLESNTRIEENVTMINKSIPDIINELSVSEENFIEKMKYFYEHYYNVIVKNSQANPFLPSKEDMKSLFKEYYFIRKFHEKHYLKRIKSRIREWEFCPYIGDVVQTLITVIQIYHLYADKYEEITKHFNGLLDRNVAFLNLFEELHVGIDLESHGFFKLLVFPFERMKQYRIILKEYLENNPNLSLTERNWCIETKKAVKTIINKDIKEESLRQLLELQAKLGEHISLIQTNKTLIKHGEINKINARSGNLQPCYLILTNNELLYCKNYPNGLRLVNTLDLCQMQIDSKSTSLEFTIKARQRVISFQGKSGLEKEIWVKKLNEIIRLVETKVGISEQQSIMSNKNYLGKQAPIWKRDDKADECFICSTLFTTIRRRHHCRACGEIVCSICSDYKLPLEYLNFKKKRVCLNCKNNLRKLSMK